MTLSVWCTGAEGIVIWSMWGGEFVDHFPEIVYKQRIENQNKFVPEVKFHPTPP